MKPITDAAVTALFAHAADFTRRSLQAGGGTLHAYFIDGLTDGDQIAAWVFRPLMQAGPVADLAAWAVSGGVWNANAEPVDTLEQLGQALVNGCCVVLFAPGRAVAFEVKGGEKRGVGQPQVEAAVKGPKDAFTETLRTNTALVRRHLRTTALAFRQLIPASRGGETAAVVWLEGRTDPARVAAVQERLEAVQEQALLSPGALEQALTGGVRTAFPLLLYTERADKFAAGLLEGRVGVLLDGLPLGYLLPCTLSRQLVSSEDRDGGQVLAAFLRALRYVALLLGLGLPGLYLAMAGFHPEMIPTPLLTAMIESHENVPWPPALEVLGLLAAFELLQEAGLHLPQSIGQSVSIIGGLVVGTAAVDARLVSPAALIVVAAAGICAFALPSKDLTDAVRLWRLILGLCAAAAGLYGLTLGALALLQHLAGLEALGVGYLEPFAAGAGLGRVLPLKGEDVCGRSR